MKFTPGRAVRKRHNRRLSVATQDHATTVVTQNLCAEFVMASVAQYHPLVWLGAVQMQIIARCHSDRSPGPLFAVLELENLRIIVLNRAN